MSLDNFKNIVDRKGYLVEEEDRQVFESSIVRSKFELNRDDFLEFIMYDISDNQLPQGDSEELVRYIPLTDDNIRNYFITTNTNLTKKPNEASEFIVDVERLVKEAGYKNGRFRTQVSIVNRRAGFEVGNENKLWIQEISPSRTEIRIVPNQRRGVINPDLEKRYSILTRDSQFRDDTIYKAKEIVDNLDVEEIFSRFLTLKGKVSTGESYVRLIQKEFGIQSFEIFVNQLKDKLVESFYYFIENREWRINQTSYGQHLTEDIDPELSVEKMEEILNTSFILIVDKYLPGRTQQTKTGLTPEELQTLDEAKAVLRQIQSNRSISTSDIQSTTSTILGCTDESAQNYNPNANTDDGSCVYTRSDEEIVVETTTTTTTSGLTAFSLSRGNTTTGACFNGNPVTLWGNSSVFENVTQWYANSQGSIIASFGFYSYDGQVISVNNNGSVSFVSNCSTPTTTTTTTQPPRRRGGGGTGRQTDDSGNQFENNEELGSETPEPVIPDDRLFIA